MLELFISVWIKLSDGSVGQAIWQKNMAKFFFIIKDAQKILSGILHSNFQAINIPQIGFTQKEILKKLVRPTDFFEE